MIAGVGVDIQDYARVRQAFERTGDAFTRRFCTPSELEWAAGDARKLAAVFSVKEACFKALGTGWADALSLELAHLPNGEPVVHKKKGWEEGKALLVSLSYGADAVIAFCVASSS
jgi:holo-[acyl-carrier-protein] synthase